MNWDKQSWDPSQKLNGGRKGFEGVMELVCTTARIFRPQLTEAGKKMLGIKDLLGNEIPDAEADPLDDSLVMVLGFTLLSKAGDPNAKVNYQYFYGGQPFVNSSGRASMHPWRKAFEYMGVGKNAMVEDMEGKPAQGLFYLCKPYRTDEDAKPQPSLWSTFAKSGSDETELDAKFSNAIVFSSEQGYSLHKKIDPSSKYYDEFLCDGITDSDAPLPTPADQSSDVGF